MTDDDAAPTNGTPDLPRERRAVVESGLAEFQAALLERARFKEERDEARVRLEALEAERNQYKVLMEQARDTYMHMTEEMREQHSVQLNDAVNRCRALEVERDQAVADRAFVESVLMLVKGAIDKAEVPAPVSNRLRKREATQRALNPPEGGDK